MKKPVFESFPKIRGHANRFLVIHHRKSDRKQGFECGPNCEKHPKDSRGQEEDSRQNEIGGVAEEIFPPIFVHPESSFPNL